MELLAFAFVVWVLKTAASDVAYAARGHVPPRLTHRAEQRGGRRRYGLRGYLGDLWHDGWVHARNQREYRLAAKRETAVAPEPAISKPAAPVVPAPAVVTPLPIVGDPPTIVDHWGDLAGQVGTKTLPAKQQPQPIPEPRRDVDAIDDETDTDTDTPLPTVKEKPVTTATGEAVNVETALVQVEAMAEDITTVGELLEGLDKERGDLETVAITFTEHLTAYDLDANAIAAVTSVQELLGREQLHEMFAAVDAARAQLDHVRDHLIATYADAADTVATTGINPQFLAA